MTGTWQERQHGRKGCSQPDWAHRGTAAFGDGAAASPGREERGPPGGRVEAAHAEGKAQGVGVCFGVQGGDGSACQRAFK